MSDNSTVQFPKTGINKYVADYLKKMPDLSGKKVLDIPCGDGRSSYEFKKKGADIFAFDLFPHFMKAPGLKAGYADLSESLPIEDGSIDVIICQEGIEHIPDQLGVLKEFNRVLKKNGILLITTPNNSHLRARLSHFFIESDFWRRMPPTEIDGVWFAEGETDQLYFGHLFLLGVQHLQSLITFAGFKVKRRIKTDLGNSSMIIGLFIYPVLILVSLLSYLSYHNKNSHVDKKTRQNILWERVKLNLSFKTLFCKHTFWELQKKSSLDEIIIKLKQVQRK